MLDQLTSLVKQFGNDAVVNNAQVPNEQNDAVMEETSNSIFTELKNMAAKGNISDIADLFKGNNASGTVKNITSKVSGNISSKFGLAPDVSDNVADNMVPNVMNSLVNKAKDPNDSSFQVSDIINAISGGNSGTGNSIMEAISKYGTQFGLDDNKDGKVEITEVIAVVTSKSGGIGGFLKRLMGK